MTLELEDIEYNICVTTSSRYRGDYGYEYSDDSNNVLTADSIEELYERIGEHYSKWIVEKEQRFEQYGRKHVDDSYHIDNQFIRYSEIYVVVAPYSEEKRNQSEGYRNVGQVRDAARAKKKAEDEAEAKRREEWNKKQTEKREKEEFERLKKKFNS